MRNVLGQFLLRCMRSSKLTRTSFKLSRFVEGILWFYGGRVLSYPDFRKRTPMRAYVQWDSNYLSSNYCLHHHFFICCHVQGVTSFVFTCEDNDPSITWLKNSVYWYKIDLKFCFTCFESKNGMWVLLIKNHHPSLCSFYIFQFDLRSTDLHETC